MSLRLEPEDTPIDIGGSVDGPQFKIPMLPSRDVKAHSLSREAARKLRERSKMFQKPPLPSPVKGGSASPSARMLSLAAHMFMRNAIAKFSRSTDESLRASYCSSNPGLGTPKCDRNISRLGRDGSMGSRSLSVTEGSKPLTHLGNVVVLFLDLKLGFVLYQRRSAFGMYSLGIEGLK